MLDLSEEEEVAEAAGSSGETESQLTENDCADFMLLHDEDIVGASGGDERRSRSPAGSGARCAIYLRQQLKSMHQERMDFEKRVEGRMIYMENVLGKVAGVQQAQLQRLVDLTTRQAKEEKPSTAETPHEATAEPTLKPQPQAAAPETPKTPRGPEAYMFNWADLSDTTVPESEEDWKSYHGYAAWHMENEKRKKNPFDHQAFVKKGEKIASVEDLMAVTFKTLSKLVERRVDVKGLISHGLFMAEKASKNVYVSEAFVAYDEGVHKRAGETGPAAFGQVLQEEVFTHFCYENTKKQKSLAQQKPKTPRSKSDKVCNRFNESGCTSKTCFYAHRCLNCDSYSHSKKTCGAAEKKKEGK